MAKRKVEVIAYLEEWKQQFENEKNRLVKIFHPSIVNIHHIGSTSVPGLSAKPIIDILAEAESLEIFEQATNRLQQEGYVAKGENGLPGRRYFFKEKPPLVRLVHLHCYKKGNHEIERHLAFRNYLRAHPNEVNRYGEVKLRAASQFPFDIDAYIEAKDSTVKELERKALKWSQSQKK